MNALKTLVVLTLVVVSISGCTSTRICNSDGGMEVMVDEKGKADIRIDDVCFRDWLAVEDVALFRNAGGILTATVSVRNTLTDKDDYYRMDKFKVQYKATWFDADGMAILPDLSLWIPVDLGGGDSKSIKIAAPTKEASRFLLRIKHVR